MLRAEYGDCSLYRNVSILLTTKLHNMAPLMTTQLIPAVQRKIKSLMF